ncbi:amylovoran biosynthesis protein AmsE [Pedobacter sp. HMWF019]|uniref:glycosyltransferase n=1 Tax=Pedobacter sp. HMWF019 TaxID=2056856 RepID=UPI000D3786DE|nr:glycosyltransferase [Pedobacter sp. HMWF019]PTT03197.1 amylovoran biosynthesis protein AmsE [Pedobacter sp. HMWF019]
MNRDFSTFSVVMSLFYKEKAEYINDSLKSLYNQTLKPTEIILVKEGTLNQEQNSVLDYWIDKFGCDIIKIVDSGEIKGLPACLNLGINSSTSEYIARFDSDDECLPDRFEKQMGFLRKNPNIDLLGAQIEEFDESMKISMGKRIVPTESLEIVKFSKWRCPFNHQTVLYKREVALQLGGYPLIGVCEDYAFWGLFIVNKFNVANLPDVLVNARTGDGLIARRSGINFLKGELKGTRYLYEIGLLGTFKYYTLVASKTILRLLPPTILTKIYASIRPKV